MERASDKNATTAHAMRSFMEDFSFKRIDLVSGVDRLGPKLVRKSGPGQQGRRRYAQNAPTIMFDGHYPVNMQMPAYRRAFERADREGPRFSPAPQVCTKTDGRLRAGVLRPRTLLVNPRARIFVDTHQLVSKMFETFGSQIVSNINGE